MRLLSREIGANRYRHSPEGKSGSLIREPTRSHPSRRFIVDDCLWVGPPILFAEGSLRILLRIRGLTKRFSTAEGGIYCTIYDIGRSVRGVIVKCIKGYVYSSRSIQGLEENDQVENTQECFEQPDGLVRARTVVASRTGVQYTCIAHSRAAVTDKTRV
jgi:hypothetical protein